MRGLYAILDPSACLDRDPVAVGRAILTGGCAALQLRAKSLDDEAYVRLAGALLPWCEAANVTFVVNDRAWLVERLGAHAVHLGQGDMPIAEARALVGARVSIGLSTHTLEEARAAVLSGADMIGFGPVFATITKADAAPVVGLAALAQVCREASVPVVAIGGITVGNISAVAAARAPLAAAIAAVCGAPSPEAAARAMHAAMLAQ